MKTVSRDRIAMLRYRRHFVDADQRQIRIVITASTVALSLTIRNDLILLTKEVLSALLLVRFAHALLTWHALRTLSKPQSLRKLDRTVGTWNLLTTMVLILVGVSRLGPRELYGPFLGAIAVICVFYFAQRGSLVTRVITCTTVTTLLLARLLDPAAGVSSIIQTTGITLLVLLNVLGIATVRSFEHQRRARYEAEREERRIRLQLIAKNRDLEIQKSRAEALYRARTTFLAAMSHEFRTPMNAVIGLSDTLVHAPIAPEYQDHARIIRESASSLLVLLNDVLDFAKIDAGKLELTNASFNLRSLVNSVVDMMRPVAQAKDIPLETRFASALPEYVLGDEARLRQILVNLLSNAIKFTSQGMVGFALESKKANGSFFEVEFTVSDTGIGMSPEVLTRLFQPFEQGDGGISRRFGGTGLGLVISQKIVNALGGEIQVKSEEGKGSTFSFVLQLEEAKAPPRRAPSLADIAETTPRSLCILVVDDLTINRMVAKLMLERLGYSADFAEDGAKAIEAVTNKTYHAVLMDLQMPVMSGIEATKAIVAKLGPERAPAIIAMSASVFEEDRLACQNAGMCDFIAKPIDIQQLEDTLARWTHRPTPSTLPTSTS